MIRLCPLLANPAMKFETDWHPEYYKHQQNGDVWLTDAVVISLPCRLMICIGLDNALTLFGHGLDRLGRRNDTGCTAEDMAEMAVLTGLKETPDTTQLKD